MLTLSRLRALGTPQAKKKGAVLAGAAAVLLLGGAARSVALAEAEAERGKNGNGEGGRSVVGGGLVLGGHGIIRSSRAISTFAINSVDYKLSSLKNAIEGKMRKSREYEEAQSEIHRRAAERLLRLCESNRGIYIKAGQFVASLQQLPKEYTTTLSVLQDQARGRPFRAIDRVIKEEFGQSATDIFEDFEEEPMAAASLAQVHRARLKDGREVAVKIQYPGLETQVETDIKTMALLSKALSWLFPDCQFNWIVPQFKENLHQQLDFQKEANNAEVTAKNFAHKKEVKVPKIYWEMTTRRVLTMEFMKGCKIDDVEGIRHQGLDPFQVASLLVEVFAEMVFCHGHLHGDPHPGNILVHARPHHELQNGRNFDLVLLDHGLYRELDDGFRRNFCRLWRALIFTDAPAVSRAGEVLGAGEYSRFLPVLFTGRPFESKARWGSRMTAEEEKQVKGELKQLSIGNLSLLIDNLPQDLFLVMRTDNLIRQHVARLGVAPRQRLFINGRYAIKGLALSHSRDLSTGAGMSLLARLWAQAEFAHLVLRIRASELMENVGSALSYWMEALRALREQFLLLLMWNSSIQLE